MEDLVCKLESEENIAFPNHLRDPGNLRLTRLEIASCDLRNWVIPVWYLYIVFGTAKV